MGTERNLHVANFICRSNEKVLLDLFQEVIYPAFSSGQVRQYGKTRFFFTDVAPKLLNGKTGEIPSICGRFIKDTKLESEQHYDEEKDKLIRKHGELQTAPSAKFLLTLPDHKLLIADETPYPPDLTSLRSTVQKFSKLHHYNYITKILEAYRESETGRIARSSRVELLDSIPYPTIELVPLASEKTISDFIESCSLVKELSLTFLDTNDDIDNEPIFDSLREIKKLVKAKKTLLQHKNKNGLDKKATTKHALPASKGNVKIVVEGYDKKGDKVRGDNEALKVSIPVGDLSDDPKKAADDMYQAYLDMVGSGLISISSVNSTIRSRWSELWSEMFGK